MLKYSEFIKESNSLKTHEDKNLVVGKKGTKIDLKEKYRNPGNY